jgi:hypothetical protein
LIEELRTPLARAELQDIKLTRISQRVSWAFCNRHCERSRSSVSRELLPFRGYGARMPPIALTDAQLSAVFEAARPLSVASRDAFLRDLAAALQGITDPGDGDVARAIRAVQRKHFDPPELDERSEPHPRRIMAKAR